ncbi:MAG TPA: hypothetical protein VH912_15315 [Streptosporangiaceae bacterium]
MCASIGLPGFRAQILSGDFGAVRINDFIQPAHEAFRTPKLIRRSDPDMCKIDVAVHGRVIVEQNGREALLRPGDFTLVDLSQPSHVGVAESRATLMVFPRSMLPLSQEELARLTAIRISGRAIRTCRRHRSPPRTTSRCATCTNCWRPRGRPPAAGSAIAAWNAAGKIFSTPASLAGRSTPSLPGGE